MANTTLPLLAAASSAADADIFLIRKSGETTDKKLTGTLLKAYVFNAPVSLANGGTGVALSDPGANTAMVWDETTNAVRFATLSGLSYNSGTNTLTATGAVAGSDTQVQFNDGGAFGADAGFTYNKTTGTLTLLGGLTSATLTGGVTASGTEKALIINNGTSTGNIFEARDNGSAVFTIADGGVFTSTASAIIPLISGSTADNGDITINGTTSGTKTSSYVILQDTGGYVGVGLTAPATNFHVTGTGINWTNFAVGGVTAIVTSSNYASGTTSRIELGETSANRPTIGPGNGVYLQILSGTTGILFTQNNGAAFCGVWENDGDLVVGSAASAGARLDITGVTGTKKAFIANNGTSTGNIIEAQDGGTAVLIVADGGTTTATANGGSNKALIANNSTSTGNIFEAQDNGTAVFTVADGGNITFLQGATIGNSGGSNSKLVLSDAAGTRLSYGANNYVDMTSTNTNINAAQSVILTAGGGNTLNLNYGSGDNTLSNYGTIHTYLQDYSESSLTAMNAGHVLSMTTGNTSAGHGNGLQFRSRSSSTSNRDMGLLGFLWTTATDATRTSAGLIRTVHNATSIDREFIGATKALTNNSAIAIANATLASNSTIGIQIDYMIEVTNGTDYQVEVGTVHVSGYNKAGAFGMTATKTQAQQNTSSGTLATTWAVSSANPAVISINANSSLTPSAGYPRISFNLRNQTHQSVALQ